MVLIGLSPHCFRLGFHSPHGAKNSYCTIEDTHGALNFDSKVHVAGRINDVDKTITPYTRSSSGGNSYPPFTLLLHPVHCGRTLVSLSHLVVTSSVEQDTLSGRGLACIYMGGNTYISYFFHFNIVHVFHHQASYKLNKTGT
jgi:hypothetical protein